MASTISSTLRRQVQKRAAGRCEYCHTSERLTGLSLEVDHIVPQAQGGVSNINNLCLACRRCNAYKSAHIEGVDPQTGHQVSLFNPRLDNWIEHFAWDETGTLILGQTPLGRATVAALRMNDPLVVRARALWVSAGWHPPTL
ncbi:MAG: HNH endonuclease [Anaerolineae bacterium]